MNTFSTCQYCNGTGLIQGDLYEWTEAYLCPFCGGSGVILTVINDAQKALLDEPDKE